MNLIVFDIDDTLTRSEDQHQAAYVHAMRELGVEEINQNWKAYEHHTDSYILKENYERNGLGDFKIEFVPIFEKKMTTKILTLQETEEIQGAGEMLQALADNKHYGVCFATGSFLQPAFIKLNQAKIPHEKGLVVGANHFYSRENIVSEAIRRAKAFYGRESFRHIISVGDGIWDLKTAGNLGLHFMGIGMKNHSDFIKGNIKAHIKDWRGFDLDWMERELDIA